LETFIDIVTHDTVTAEACITLTAEALVEIEACRIVIAVISPFIALIARSRRNLGLTRLIWGVIVLSTVEVTDGPISTSVYGESNRKVIRTFTIDGEVSKVLIIIALAGSNTIVSIIGCCIEPVPILSIWV